MEVSATIPADAEATELMHPSDHTFYLPASFAQSPAQVATTRDVGANAKPRQQPAQRVGIIGLIRNQGVRTRTRPADLATDRWHFDNGWQGSFHVVRICRS